MVRPETKAGFSWRSTCMPPVPQRTRCSRYCWASAAARPRASTSLWYLVFQPRRCSRIVVWMSSVTVSTARPPTSRSASMQTTAPVPHQKGAFQRFRPGCSAR